MSDFKKNDIIKCIKTNDNFKPIKVGDYFVVDEVLPFEVYKIGSCSCEYDKTFHLSKSVINEFFEPAEYITDDVVVGEKPDAYVSDERINWLIDNSDIVTTTVFDKCTVLCCKLPNGFVLTESSSCVSPENYDEDLGYEICMDRLISKLFELEAYLLQEEMYGDDYHKEDDDAENYDCPYDKDGECTCPNDCATCYES